MRNMAVGGGPYCSTAALIVCLLCSTFTFSFQLSTISSRCVAKKCHMNSVTPKSPIDCRSDFISTSLRSLLLPVACITAAAVSSRSASADDGEFDPLVQGIIDFDDKPLLPTAGDNFLVQVYDSSVKEAPVLLAGAKLPFAPTVTMPFRFQLFKENLLVTRKVWDETGDFDQRVVVTLCRGPIEKGGVCKGEVLRRGEGVSKVVIIGTPATEVRGVRLFAFVKLKPPI